MAEEKIKKTVKKVKETKLAEAKNSLIVIIRIKGEVEIKKDIVETLFRLRLRKKYSATLINLNNKGLVGMLDKVKHHVAYGEIDKQTLVDLIKARAQSIDHKKINPEEVAEAIINGKTLTELGLKGFFRLHPPRKGIDSKQVYPKGVLGNHKENINKLVERML